MKTEVNSCSLVWQVLKKELTSNFIADRTPVPCFSVRNGHKAKEHDMFHT